MLSCWWHPPFLPPAFQVWVHYHLFNWVIIIELTITWCHPTAFLISPFFFFLMCIYSYILREEPLNFLSFVTPFPGIPGSPKSLDACRAGSDPVLSQYWPQAAPWQHRSSQKGRWGGSGWAIFNKSTEGCSAYPQDQPRISYSSFQLGCVQRDVVDPFTSLTMAQGKAARWGSSC